MITRLKAVCRNYRLPATGYRLQYPGVKIGDPLTKRPVGRDPTDHMRSIYRLPTTVYRLQFALLLFCASVLSGQSSAKRPLRPSDIYRIRAVSDPQLSSDGKWVSYTVSSADSAKDKNDSDVWMVSWDGTQNIRVTSTPEGESKGRWSPDGKYLSFVSSRQGAENGQLWLMDRAGGEAQ
jgi:hypothetical protein